MTTVSPQERRLYDGLATIENITKNFHLVKVGGIQLKITKVESGGYQLCPMSVAHGPMHHMKMFNEFWNDIYEIFGITHNIQRKMKTYELREENLTNAFGKPGRHPDWKMVSMLVEEKMEQLYFNKKGSWMDINMWAQRVGTAQGWTKVNEEFLTITDPKNKMDTSKMIVPKIRTHNESLPFYNADKSNVTNGRFMFPF